MSDFSSLLDLPVADDLNIPYSAEEYADQANPQPPAPGVYRFQVLKSGVRKDKEGKAILKDGKFPILVLERVKIVEPTENEREFGLFGDVNTKPGKRKGAQGQDVAFSDLYDLIRGYDATLAIPSFEEALAILEQQLGSNNSFVAQLTWEGYDSEYVKSQFAAIEAAGTLRKDVAKDVSNAIYNKARLRAKDYVKNGVRVTSIEGPSGNTIEARPKISRYYASNSRDLEGLKFGPFKSAK